MVSSLKGLLLAGCAGFAAGGLASAAAILLPFGFFDQRIEAILDGRASVAPIVEASDPGEQIEAYLLANPSILERVSIALNEERAAEQRVQAKALIAANHEAIFGETGAVVVGNPAGDVSLVELYDYNCGFCRSAFPDLVALLEQDSELRLVLRQFPILSQGSVDAAKVGTVVANEGVDYFAFHQAIFTSRGQVDLETALAAAEDVGLDPMAVRGKLNTPGVDSVIAGSFALAQKLGISGTPTFILADEIIPGAVGIDILREKIANVRACGSTRCSS